MSSRTSLIIIFTILVVLCLATPARAFGAGNIQSISKIEGINYRHGDIEDTLKTLVFLHRKKWGTMDVRRVYFGNWLRDYSQALDVGTLQRVNKDTIRLLVWLLGFLSFGYATAEFEVTEERLGVYRPEEHIDNPKNYADDKDARVYDERLRPPVHPDELAIDPLTGMKNYIANESGGWATSSGYVKHSLNRSIYYGRKYHSDKNKEDLCEALRCLGQSLHCLEDFSAHSNYVELALRELGFHDVFSHTGEATEMHIGGHRGKRAFPIITGTFGGVDFLHSVLGEFQDKFSQTEVNESELGEMNELLGNAQKQQKQSERGPSGSILKTLLSQIPNGGSELSRDAERLEEESNAQEMANMSLSGAPGSAAKPADINAMEVIKKIYPILAFRDRVMRAIETTIEKIPGLSALVEKISDTLSIFVFSLLAPFVCPIINQASQELAAGSSEVLDSSANHQFEPWTDPHCTDPTHSLLSKDHFSNKLNSPAGEVASSVLAYVVPRVMYAYENPGVPVQQVLDDVVRVLHHPAIRDPNCEIHATMFDTVRRWVEKQPDRGASLNHDLSRQGVREGCNHVGGAFAGGHGGGDGHSHAGKAGHGKPAGGVWDQAKKKQSQYGGGGSGSGGGDGGGAGGIKLPGVVGGLVGGLLDGFSGDGSSKRRGEAREAAPFDAAGYAHPGSYERIHPDAYEHSRSRSRHEESSYEERRHYYDEHHGHRQQHHSREHSRGEREYDEYGQHQKHRRHRKSRSRDSDGSDSDRGRREEHYGGHQHHHSHSQSHSPYPPVGGEYGQHAPPPHHGGHAYGHQSHYSSSEYEQRSYPPTGYEGYAPPAPSGGYGYAPEQPPMQHYGYGYDAPPEGEAGGYYDAGPPPPSQYYGGHAGYSGSQGGPHGGW